MTRHISDSGRGLAGLIFGTGWVQTRCGVEVPASNGPDNDGEPVTCSDCQSSEPKMFLGLF